jgi:hypothetical protein
MDKSFVTKNTSSRERLRKLVNEITDEELNLVIYKEGWTVAVVLAHLAFWDERRRVLVRKWKKKGVSASPIEEDITNDALVTFFLALPVREAANMAILTAEALDHELEALSPDLITAIEALGERHALDRSIHRKIHLDEIEALLRTKRTKDR